MRRLALVVTGLIAASAPGVALGASRLPPGVHVNPSSPAGEQYAILVTAARGETAGNNRSGAGDPPLFGAGVTRTTNGSGLPASSGTQSASSDGRQSRTGRSRTGHSHSGAVVGSNRTPPPGGSGGPPAAVGLRGQAGSGGSAWLALLGGAAAFVILGGGGGLALRRIA